MSVDVTELDDYRRIAVQLTDEGRRARLDVLSFARRGMSASDIALRLGLSESVVDVLLGLRLQPGAPLDPAA